MPQNLHANSFHVGHIDIPFEDLLKQAIPHPLQQGILPIITKSADGAWQVAGTAFAIAEDLCLSAAHVLLRDHKLDVEQAYVWYVGKSHDEGTVGNVFLPLETVSPTSSTT